MKKLGICFLAVILSCFICAGFAKADSTVGAAQEYKQAKTLASAGKWKEAVAASQRALKFDPNYPDALYLAGVCCMNLNDYKQAEKYIKKLTNLRPEFFNGWGMLSQIYVVTKQYEAAKKAIGELSKVKGGGPESHYMMGVLAWCQSDLATAEKEWQTAIKLKPDMAKAHHNLAVLLRSKGEKARALSSFQVAQRLNSESYLYQFNLALMQIEVGNKIDGMANLDKVRSQTERPDLALLALAEQMLINNHYNQADKASQRAIENNPDLYEAYLVRAKALEKLNKPGEALICYKKVLEQNPNSKEAKDAEKRISKALDEKKAKEKANTAQQEQNKDALLNKNENENKATDEKK